MNGSSVPVRLGFSLILMVFGLIRPGRCGTAVDSETNRLALPPAGGYEMRILSPTLLEIALVGTKAPDPEGTDVMTWERLRAKGPFPSHFEVTAGERKIPVKQVGFKRRVLYAPLKVRDLRVMNSLYLVLESRLKEGEVVAVREPEGKIWPKTVHLQEKMDRDRWSPVVHVNQVGFLPEGPKRVVVGYYLGSLGEMPVRDVTSFAIEDARTGATVFRGGLKPRREQGLEPAAYQEVREGDFTGFTTPGRYRVSVPDLGVSLPFSIDEGIAAAFARTYALGLYHQRCGCANSFPFTRHVHGACHLAPAEIPTLKFTRTQEFLAGMSSDFKEDPEHSAPQLKDVQASLYPFVRQGPIDVSGGHHDAGDYSKYTINSAGLIHHLVFAADAFPGVAALDNLGIPESGDGKSDLLQEAKWEADFLAKMQDNDGGFYFLVYPKDRKYEDNVLPDHGDPQVVWPKNTSASAAAVAALAQTGSSPKFRQLFPEAAEQYLSKAKLGWTFLQAALRRHTSKGAYQKLTHYGDTFRHNDEIIWAATELFLATGDPKYQKFLGSQFDPSSPATRRWTWWRLYEGYGCAIRSYAFATRTGRLKADQLLPELSRRCLAELVAAGEDQLRYAQESAYAVSYPGADKRYRSASWFFPIDRAFDLAVAYQLSPKPEFARAIWSNVDYEAGCNPVNVTFVTGLGTIRQREIVHQYAQNDRRVLPPSGIPLGSIQTGFGYLNLYRKQLGALTFPPDWDKERPFPIYDRWGDSFNLSTEFVVVNQARGLATLAFLAAQTPLKDQTWKPVTGKIQLTPLSRDPVRVKAELVAPGVDLSKAQIVWEAKDLEPILASAPEIAPLNVGPQWIEAEACLPDGRRVFASTNFFARSVQARAFTVRYQSEPQPQGVDLVALFRFDNDLTDAVVPSRRMETAGAPMVDSSNLAWMKSPKGGALRLQSPADRITGIISSKEAASLSRSGFIFEALIFVSQFPASGGDNSLLLSLSKGSRATIELYQDRWAERPLLRAAGQTLLDRERLEALLTPEVWHRLRISLDRAGYRVAVDDKEVIRKPSGDLGDWAGPSDLRLQAGGFNGWIDELILRSSSGNP